MRQIFLKQVIAWLLMGGIACWCARRGSQINVVKELNWWVGGYICIVCFEADPAARLRPNVRPACRNFCCHMT
jgi:hypothetical protein